MSSPVCKIVSGDGWWSITVPPLRLLHIASHGNVRSDAQLERAKQAIGRNVTAVQGDVSNLADLDRLCATNARSAASGSTP